MAGSYVNGVGIVTFLDYTDASCALNATDTTIDREVVQARTFCQNIVVPGQRKLGQSFGGFGYFGTNEHEETLDTLVKSGADVRQLTVYGNTAGSVYYEVTGPLTSKKMTASPTEIVGISGDIGDGETLNRGLALHVNQTFTGNGNQTGQACGATAATETFVAVVRCKSVSGSGSFTVKFQESSDDGSGDAYANITGLTVSVSGNAAAGTSEATFTGAGIAVFTKVAAVETYRRLVISGWATLTNAVLTVTSGTQAPA